MLSAVQKWITLQGIEHPEKILDEVISQTNTLSVVQSAASIMSSSA
jgi:hypothetical protein